MKFTPDLRTVRWMVRQMKKRAKWLTEEPTNGFNCCAAFELSMFASELLREAKKRAKP